MPASRTQNVPPPSLGTAARKQSASLWMVWAAVGLSLADPSLGGTAGLLLATLALVPRITSIRILPGVRALGLLVLWGILSSAWTYSGELTLHAVRDLLVAIVFVVAIGTVCESRSDCQVIGVSFAIGTAILALRFLAQNGLDPSAILSASPTRATIPGINANMIAYTLTTGVALTAILAQSRTNMAKLAWVAIVVVMAACVGMTGSRGALLAIGLSCAWTLGYPVLKRHSRRLFIVAFWLLPLAAISGRLDELFRPAGATLRDTGDLNGRLTIWPIARMIFEEHPVFGIGWGAFEEFAGFGIRTHNAYLAYAAETGAIGLTLFCLALYGLSITGSMEKDNVPLVSGALAIVSAPLLYTGAWDRSPVMWIALALSAAIFRTTSLREHCNVPPALDVHRRPPRRGHGYRGRAVSRRGS